MESSLADHRRQFDARMDELRDKMVAARDEAQRLAARLAAAEAAKVATVTQAEHARNLGNLKRSVRRLWQANGIGAVTQLRVLSVAVQEAPFSPALLAKLRDTHAHLSGSTLLAKEPESLLASAKRWAAGAPQSATTAVNAGRSAPPPPPAADDADEPQPRVAGPPAAAMSPVLGMSSLRQHILRHQKAELDKGRDIHGCDNIIFR